ncbi:major facilitator superfamily domain-containing protein [Microdochium trichocladiopsis]|uniref:Major facilitator superfamily domain-containing protein n=1 Tax=Microdochium trichocladiopsis TaxID=1682393 RepID=A0A9P9BV66_9PEZI|nr:major facilitator superfamily domain-containing protein [Microdochium trichocladiopsis]KAH7040018.1 major facilitator superfamily domain-containing protein [Microdochium trichocladiopsis]
MSSRNIGASAPEAAFDEKALNDNLEAQQTSTTSKASSHDSHHDSSSSDDEDDVRTAAIRSPRSQRQSGDKSTTANDTTAAADGGNNPLTTTRTNQTSRSRTSSTLRRTTSNALAAALSRITTRDWPEPPPPPDGGLKAWTQVACGWLVIFTTWGYVNSFGAFQTYYTATLAPQGIPPSTISWIGSVQIWLTLIVGVFSGRLLDAGWFIPTFFVGAVIQVLGMFLMSLSGDSYWQLMLTQGVMTGIGGGIFFTPSVALVTTYFQARRGLAVGLVTVGNSAGGIIYPVVVRELIPKVGFPWTARVLAFINLGALSVVFAFMRPRLPPRQSGPIIDWTAIREPVYVAFVVAFFALMWGNYFTFYYIASYGREVLGLDYAAASTLVMIINGVGMPFRVLFPWLSDRCGTINVMLPVAAVWAIVAFCWLAVPDVKGYYIYTTFYGICSAGFQSMFPTIIASITKRLDMTGTRLGMAFGVTSMAALTGPPLGGAILAAGGGSYTGAQVWAACMTTIGMSCVAFARFKAAGLQVKIKC